jgi:hypothetical protein
MPHAMKPVQIKQTQAKTCSIVVFSVSDDAVQQ